MSFAPLLTSAVLDVHHDAANRWLYLDWKGPQRLGTVQLAGQQLLALIAQTGVAKLLNDSTHVTSLTLEAVQWVARQFLPEVGRAGVQYMAWVSSPHLSCYHNIDMIAQPPGQHPHVEAFADLAAACVWLNNLAPAHPVLAPPPAAHPRYRQPAVLAAGR